MLCYSLYPFEEHCLASSQVEVSGSQIQLTWISHENVPICVFLFSVASSFSQLLVPYREVLPGGVFSGDSMLRLLENIVFPVQPCSSVTVCPERDEGRSYRER